MIFDTNVLFAALDIGDKHHAACRSLFEGQDRRIVPDTVLQETALMVSTRLGVEAEALFLLAADADFDVTVVSAEDRSRSAELLRQYEDADIGYVDASIVAVAERLRESTIATLDRRHFGMFRPEGMDHFQLVP